VWVGTAPNKRPGEPVDAVGAARRQAALLEYLDGPVEDRIVVPPYPPYHGGEREADIGWVLEYFEEP
jgi:hypothetical protein